MAFLDALTLLSDAQAFGASAVSTSSYDLGSTTPVREVGTGETLSLAVQVDVAGTVAATTIDFISATDAALTTSVLVHASRSVPLASMTAGSVHVLDMPDGTPTQRYMGARLVTAGGTVTATVWIGPASMISIAPKAYADNRVT